MRAIVIVMDSVGIGELPDAVSYGDKGSNTLGNIARSIRSLKLPNLQKLGLGNIEGSIGYKREAEASGCYGKMAEISAGKDTTTGHWEMMGIILNRPFPVYPHGFPEEVIRKFEAVIGTSVLGNYPASGTEIIKLLGEQHVKTGYPIVYTSADSVFQIAAHEDIIPIEKLYEMCQKARDILIGEHAVGRVIARPFTGSVGSFVRTERRHDFSLKPIEKTVLDLVKAKGHVVKTVGKIFDIYCGQGITESVHTHNNKDGVDRTIEFMKQEFDGLLFTNLVDFDMLYGHRNDVAGYARALSEFDERIPELLGNLKNDDVLFITADHGCDPTTESTDHSREYVPLLVYGKKIKKGVNVGTRETFADLGATVAEILDIEKPKNGKSFWNIVNK